MHVTWSMIFFVSAVVAKRARLVPYAPSPLRLSRASVGSGRAVTSTPVSRVGHVVAASARGVTPHPSASERRLAGSIAGRPRFQSLRPEGAGPRGSLITAFALAPAGLYRALTRIRVREAPDTSALPTGATVEPGEEFEVESSIAGEDHMAYLKVAKGGGGWVFEQGIAGRWVGKPIVEFVGAREAGDTGVASQMDDASGASDGEGAAMAADPVVTLASARVETLRMPSNMLGAGFEFVQLEAKGARQPLVFLLGTGFPVNALTEAGREAMGDQALNTEFKGGWLSEATKAAMQTNLEDVMFVGSGFSLGSINNIEIMDFPQAQLAAQMGLEVHGILGKPFFEQYDMDLDRYAQRLNLFAPGQASSQGFYRTVKHLPGFALPSGGVGIAVRGGESAAEHCFFVGVLDSAAAHSIINWEAARLLGFSGPQDPRLQGATKVLGPGAKGQPEEMPVVLLRLALSGVREGVKPMIVGLTKDEFDKSGGKGWYLDKIADDTQDFLELGAVNVAIGDFLGLASLGDSSVGAFTGAAAVVGQDLLFQAQRVILNARDKQLWLEAGDVRDAAEM